MPTLVRDLVTNPLVLSLFIAFVGAGIWLLVYTRADKARIGFPSAGKYYKPMSLARIAFINRLAKMPYVAMEARPKKVPESLKPMLATQACYLGGHGMDPAYFYYNSIGQMWLCVVDHVHFVDKWEYAYDALGRVVLVTRSSTVPGDNTAFWEYTYNGDSLQFEVQMYNHNEKSLSFRS